MLNRNHSPFCGLQRIGGGPCSCGASHAAEVRAKKLSRLKKSLEAIPVDADARIVVVANVVHDLICILDAEDRRDG